MGNESVLVSLLPMAFTVVDHFTTLPLPTMGLFYSTYEEEVPQGAGTRLHKHEKLVGPGPWKKIRLDR